MLRSHDDKLLLKLIDRRQSARDRGLPIDVLADIQCVATLVGHQLSIDTQLSHQSRMGPTHDQEIRPPKTDLCSFGLMLRFQQLSFDIGVIRSDGNEPRQRSKRSGEPLRTAEQRYIVRAFWRIILSLDPEVLQSMISSPQSGNAFELTQRWHGTDPILRDLLINIRSEIQSGSLRVEQLCARPAGELIQWYPIGKLRLDQYKGGLQVAH